MKVIRLVTLFFLIGLFVTTGILPAFSRDEQPFVPTEQQSNLVKAQNWVEQGRQAYQTEKYQEAINKLEQAGDIFATLKESESEAITRSNLSLAHQQLKQWQKAKEEISKSLSLVDFNYDLELPDIWILSDIALDKLPILANIINIYGRLKYFQGDFKQALTSWQFTTKIYQKLDNNQKIVSTQINQIQALQALGLYQEAKNMAEAVEKNLDYLPDNLKFKGLISLGNVFRATGNLVDSEYFLQQSLEIAKNDKSSNDIAASNLSLADTWQAWGNLEQERRLPIRYDYYPWSCEVNKTPEEANTYYEKAENNYQQILDYQKTIISTTGIKAQLNLLKLLINTNKWSKAQELVDKIDLSELPNSRTKVYTQINFAKSLVCLNQQGNLESISWDKAIGLLQDASDNAKALKDKRAKSYAIGNLGGLYEYLALIDKSNQSPQWRKQAIGLTQQALYLAQPREMPDIAYQWQWQLGRLAKAEGNTRKSINYYQAAVETLETVRGDLIAINSDVQFSFRDNVEPVYRQLAQLLLKQPVQKNLTQTSQLIQNLQLAELENYLGCNLENTQALDKIANRIDSTEAIIYPIILDGEIDVILKLPNQAELEYHNTKVSKEEVEKLLQRLQNNLPRPDARKKVQKDASKLYQWIIAPMTAELEQSEVDTLVFFLDTPLRNVPMAVLYDNNDREYLIEKYAVAITSGLELLEPQPLSRGQINAMLAGLTQSVRDRLPLKNTDEQFKRISSEIPSEILLDEGFTVSNFQSQLQSLPFPVVHIATHGQFSSKPEETFIEAWDRSIYLNQLSNLLKNSKVTNSTPIELLVLAACQTAQGDKRATLGLAGVAINAGAKSTLATLWKVSADDSPGLLLSQFYQKLIDEDNLTKAQALQHAQLEFLKDDSLSRPYFWASYVLLGNWL